jgi:anti-anti-sigma regulatory factor
VRIEESLTNSTLPEDDRGVAGGLSVTINRVLGTVVVAIAGALDATGALRLRYLLSDLIGGQGNLKLVIDLHEAHRVGAEAVDALAEAVDDLRRRGGELILSAPREGARLALERLTGRAGVTVTRT